MPIQKTNVYNPGAPGIDFAQANLTWTVAKDVLVSSGGSPAVRSVFNDSTLVNKGNIVSGNDYAVQIDAPKNATVINDESAMMFGESGVGIGGSSKNATIENHGLIFGADDHGVYAANASNFTLDNTGEIFGASTGLYFKHTLDVAKGSEVRNSGLIHSDGYGIFSEVQPELTTTVVNKKGGTIEGDSYAVLATDGGLSITNKGILKGKVTSIAAAKDKVVNEGKIKGTVDLGYGDDVYKNNGGKAGMVHGDAGNDTLIAGKSKDKFVFDTTLNANTNVDRVKNFESGKDKFFLDASIFDALAVGDLPGSAFEKGKFADDASDHIIYDKSTGALYYDADGHFPGSFGVQFAQLDAGQKLKADDFMVIA